MGHAFVSDLRRWDIVSGLCQSIDARTYVEIGCKAGETTGRVLAECPQLSAIAIDPWCEQPKPGSFVTRLLPIGQSGMGATVEEVSKIPEDPTRETYADWDFRKIEAEFWKNVGDNSERCQQVRTTSAECAGDVPSREVYDVVFIDALHDYTSVKEDIALWWPLVREGGYLCGHDANHRWPGVMRAVAEHFNLMDVCLGPDSMWWVQKPVAGRAAV